MISSSNSALPLPNTCSPRRSIQSCKDTDQSPSHGNEDSDATLPVVVVMVRSVTLSKVRHVHKALGNLLETHAIEIGKTTETRTIQIHHSPNLATHY